jgi:hypothetical protein
MEISIEEVLQAARARLRRQTKAHGRSRARDHALRLEAKAALDDIVETDASSGRKRNDGIARTGRPLEIYHAPGHRDYRSVGGDGCFYVPLGSLRARAFRNLWLARRTIGADPAAFAFVRAMGSAFATGHAASVDAASQVAASGSDPDAT